jgi:hypothetical protein
MTVVWLVRFIVQCRSIIYSFFLLSLRILNVNYNLHFSHKSREGGTNGTSLHFVSFSLMYLFSIHFMLNFDF